MVSVPFMLTIPVRGTVGTSVISVSVKDKSSTPVTAPLNVTSTSVAGETPSSIGPGNWFSIVTAAPSVVVKVVVDATSELPVTSVISAVKATSCSVSRSRGTVGVKVATVSLSLKTMEPSTAEPPVGVTVKLVSVRTTDSLNVATIVVSTAIPSASSAGSTVTVGGASASVVNVVESPANVFPEVSAMVFAKVTVKVSSLARSSVGSKVTAVLPIPRLTVPATGPLVSPSTVKLVALTVFSSSASLKVATIFVSTATSGAPSSGIIESNSGANTSSGRGSVSIVNEIVSGPI